MSIGTSIVNSASDFSFPDEEKELRRRSCMCGASTTFRCECEPFDFSSQLHKPASLLLHHRWNWGTEDWSRFPRSHSTYMFKPGSKFRLGRGGVSWDGTLNSVFFQLPLTSREPSATVPDSPAELGFQAQILLSSPLHQPLESLLCSFCEGSLKTVFQEMKWAILRGGKKHNLTKDKHGCIWK